MLANAGAATARVLRRIESFILEDVSPWIYREMGIRDDVDEQDKEVSTR